MRLRHHVKVMEAAIPHQQHARTHRAQEAETTVPFAGVTRPEAGIHHGMRATLHQVDPLYLGKGTVPAVAMMAAKDRHVGGCISDIFHGAINRHQAQPKQKRTWCGLCRQRLTNLVKQRHQRPRPSW